MPRGRPKLADDVVRDRTLSLRLTADERAALNVTAAAIGVTPSEFARVELLAAAEESLKQPEQPEQPPETEVDKLRNLAICENPVLPPLKKVPNNTAHAVLVEKKSAGRGGKQQEQHIRAPEPYRTRPLPKLPHPGAIYTRPVKL